MALKKDDLLDTYYFTRDKAKEMNKLASDFPSVFTFHKKVPLNFQLRMNELIDGQSRFDNDWRDRLSFDNRLHKTELRRKYMRHVLETKEDHLLFQNLCDEEDEDKPIWYYVTISGNLEGPLTNTAMQELWEKRQILPDTLVKKKLSSEFVPACQMLNTYCRTRLVRDIKRAIPQHFSSPINKRACSSEDQEEIDRWLRIIGKRPDITMSNPLFSNRTSFSEVPQSTKQGRHSVSFKNPRVFEEKTKDTDPSELFSMDHKTENHSMEGKDPSKKRGSLYLDFSDRSGPHNWQGNFRKRVATTNVRGSKF